MLTPSYQLILLGAFALWTATSFGQIGKPLQVLNGSADGASTTTFLHQGRKRLGKSPLMIRHSILKYESLRSGLHLTFSSTLPDSIDRFAGPRPTTWYMI